MAKDEIQIEDILWGADEYPTMFDDEENMTLYKPATME